MHLVRINLSKIHPEELRKRVEENHLSFVANQEKYLNNPGVKSIKHFKTYNGGWHMNERPKKKNTFNIVETLMKAYPAGVMICIGSIAYVASELKILGAILFSIGLLVVCMNGFNLFTGRICYPKSESFLGLVFTWIFNCLGAYCPAFLIRYTRFGDELSAKAAAICNAKLSGSYLSVFLLGIFCNLMIFIAVDEYKNCKHEIGKYLSVVLCVTIFVYCGFEHCIANIAYLAMGRVWTIESLVFILINTAGNIVGGLLANPLLGRFEHVFVKGAE